MLGYRIRNNRRGDFEIEGISPELCQRFSKPHEQIEQELEKLLVPGLCPELPFSFDVILGLACGRISV